MLIETEMSERARALSTDSRRAVGGASATDVRQRAEAAFLRALVADLQPMLRESMRSHRIELGSDEHGVLAMESDGGFVHVGVAGQRSGVEPIQVLRAVPSLLVILLRIEAELDEADDERGTRAADIVRLARHCLGVADVAP